MINYHVFVVYMINYHLLCKVNERTKFSNVRFSKPLKSFLGTGSDSKYKKTNPIPQVNE